MPWRHQEMNLPRVHRWSRVITPWYAVLVILTSLVSLTGWITHNSWLTTIFPGFVSIKVNTTLGLICLSGALLVRWLKKASGKVLLLPLLLMPVLIGLLSLAEYLFHCDLHIDNLLIMDRDTPVFPGRPAQTTLICFISLAVAVWLIDGSPRQLFIAQVLLVLTALPSAVAINGYLFRAPGLLLHVKYPAVAVQTAISFLVLCSGALLERPEEGAMRVFSSTPLASAVARRLLPVGALVPVLAGLVVIGGEVAGWYGDRFGFALLATFSSALFALGIWWIAWLLMERETAVLQMESRFKNTFEQAPVGIAHLSAAGRWVRVNQALCDLTGFSRDRLLGQLPQAVIHPDDAERAMNTIDSVRAGGSAANGPEIRFMTRDGSFRWASMTAAYVRDPGGNAGYTIVVVEDQSMRKKSEQVLRESEQKLRELLAAREQDGIQLRAARDLAETASKTKDQFLAVLSHELRTPLTPVMATLDSIDQQQLSPELTESMAMIRRNIELEARLIDDLLDLTRIARGKIELHQEAVDLNERVTRAMELWQHQANLKRITLQRNNTAGKTLVWADPTRILQVIWNLIGNAVKFSPPDKPIFIRLFNPQAGQISVEVTDAGVGIDPELVPRLFNAFEQGEAAISRRYGGLGLGLSISKSLLELHGGAITAASAGRNQGATFTITLKAMSEATELQTAAPDIAPVQTKRAIPKGGAGTMTALSAKRRLLLVEDNPDTLKIMQLLLRRLGFEVTIATGVTAALEAAQREHFDLLVSDIGLPDGSGWDIIKTLRQTQHIRGIAISGFGMDEDLTRSREAGFQQHLVKPVSFESLKHAVEKAASEPAFSEL